jgi:purine-nucleoside phosphorylase
MSEEEAVRRAAAFLACRFPVRPKVAIILGSGLGGVAFGRALARIPYRRIPGFLPSGVAGHAGILTLEGRAAVLRGRAHLYEGRPVEEVVRPVRVLARLGARTLLVTNSAGGVRASFRPGDLMVVEDHLNLTGADPLRGAARFTDLSRAYDGGLRRAALAAARRLGIRMRRGVYAAVPGPSYETPAEVRMLRRLGADAVGMSTVPEVIAAVAQGMRVLAVSVVANRAGGGGSHEEVIGAAGRAGARLGALLGEIVAGLGTGGAS